MRYHPPISLTKLFSACVLGLLSLTNLGSAQFSAPSPFSVAAESLATGDFDADGMLDIATGSSQGVFVVFGANTASPSVANLGLGVADILRSGDMDGDGYPDLLAYEQAFARLRVHLNRHFISPGAFITLEIPNVGSGLLPLHLVDLENDGDLDISWGGIAMTNDGSGFFTPLSTSLAWTSRAVPGDFNGDGFADLAVFLNAIPPAVSIHLGDGTGVVRARGVFNLPTPMLDGVVRSSDLNRDGYDDIVILGRGSPQIVTFLADASGGLHELGITNFGLLPSGNSIPTPPSFTLLDFDADGDQDFIASEAYSFASPLLPRFAALRCNGAGDLSPWQVFGSEVGESIVSGDFNFDGREDIVFRDTSGPAGSSTNVSLRLSQVPIPQTPRFTILQGSGQVTARGLNHPLPLEVELKSAAGLPMAGEMISFLQSSSANAINVTTDAAGRASITAATLNLDRSETVDVLHATSSARARFVLRTRNPRSLQIVGGDNQASLVSALYPSPLVVRCFDTLAAAPIPGASVVFRRGNTILTTVISNAAGQAQITLSAQAQPGLDPISASFSDFPFTPVNFNLSSMPVMLSIQSGDGQVVRSGEAFSSPLVVLATDAGGLPLSGLSIDFTQGSAAAVSILSNAAGLASFAPPTSFGVGAVTVSATHAAARVDFQLFLRDLRALTTSAGLGIFYAHGRNGVPIILAADLPLPAPITTVWGQIHTSLLAPSPVLTILSDGFTGDPNGITAAPGAAHVFIPPANFPLGFSVIFQAYGIDLADPAPGIFISNPLLINF